MNSPVITDSERQAAATSQTYTYEKKQQPKEGGKRIYTDNEEELKKIEIEKGLYLRLLKVNECIYVDIRRYYRDFPTKRGVRLTHELFDQIKNLI